MGSLGSSEPTPTRTVRQLDIGKYLNGTEAQKEEFCADIVDDMCNVGFVKLTNHGIAPSQVDEVFEWNRKFFAMPLEAKNKAAHPKQPNPHRGYSYVGQEKLSKVKDFEKGDRNGVEVMDIKESYDQGPADDEMYPNRWPAPEDLPGYREFMESFYLSCHQVHLDILRAIATGLGYKPDFLEHLCQKNTSELRLNHYPATSADSIRQGAKRISEHTDFGTITLLFQDSVGGLEIEDQKKRGFYFPIAPGDKYDIIVNIGDCLQRWTNDKVRSTSHRVVLPPIVGDWVDDRYSVAYFAKPNRDQSVGPLREFVPAGEQPKYDDISAWEYNQQKLLLTY